MDYTSIPSFLLHLPNWNQLQQQQNQDQDVGNSGDGVCDLVVESNRPQLLPLQQQQQPISPPTPGGIAFSRPNSTADRARQAKLLPLQPDQATLKCPRCESTNTKFCYYNNYSLSQPRHFCKACRRYWTRGGTLRNVPVGGGCRKNKRTKTSSSRTNNNTKARIGSSVAVNRIDAMASSHSFVGPTSHLPLLNSLPDHYGSIPLLNFGENLITSTCVPVDYQIPAVSGTGLGLDDQWQTTDILYRFVGEEDGFKTSAQYNNQIHQETQEFGLIIQSSSEKMQDKLNLQDQYVGMNRNDVETAGNVIGSDINTSTSGGRRPDQYWTDLTGLTASTTENLM